MLEQEFVKKVRVPCMGGKRGGAADSGELSTLGCNKVAKQLRQPRRHPLVCIQIENPFRVCFLNCHVANGIEIGGSRRVEDYCAKACGNFDGSIRTAVINHDYPVRQPRKGQNRALNPLLLVKSEDAPGYERFWRLRRAHDAQRIILNAIILNAIVLLLVFHFVPFIPLRPTTPLRSPRPYL